MSGSLSKSFYNLKVRHSHRYSLAHNWYLELAQCYTDRSAVYKNPSTRSRFQPQRPRLFLRLWNFCGMAHRTYHQTLERCRRVWRFSKSQRCAVLLKVHSGIKGLEYESGLRDPKAAIGIPTIPGHPEPVVRLLAIFSNEVSSFPRPLSQEKVDRLSEILGGLQPKWWVDHDDPRSYD